MDDAEIRSAVARMRAKQAEGGSEGIAKLVDTVRAHFPKVRGARFRQLAEQLGDLAGAFGYSFREPAKENAEIGRKLEEARRGNAPEFAALILKWLWLHHRPEAEALMGDDPSRSSRINDSLTLRAAPESSFLIQACRKGFAVVCGTDDHLVGTLRLRFDPKSGKLMQGGEHGSRFILSDGRRIEPDHAMFERAIASIWERELPEHQLLSASPSYIALERERRSRWIEIEEADLTIVLSRRLETLEDENLPALFVELHRATTPDILWKPMGAAAQLIDRLVEHSRTDMLIAIVTARPIHLDFPSLLMDPEHDELHLLMVHLIDRQNAWLQQNGSQLTDAVLGLRLRLSPQLIADLEKIKEGRSAEGQGTGEA